MSNLKVFIYALMSLLILVTAGGLLSVFLADPGFVIFASVLGAAVCVPIRARANTRGITAGWMDEF